MRTFDLKVQRYLQEMKLIEQGEKILVAVSGGMDSMALLQYVYNQRQQLEIEVFVVHVDHMLRGEESHKNRLFVEAYCKERGITIFSRAISIPTIIEHESGNLQSVCRRERYLYFEEIMKKHGINKLVTAHHADDQLESLLISITKGATVNGMQGIKPIRKLPAGGVIIRPFLAVTKDEIRLYLMEQGISYREDASNAKDDYLRNRIRHHIIPLLKQENEAVSGHVVHFTKQLQEDDMYLMTQAESLFSTIVSKNNENKYALKIDELQKSPLALQRRIILILLNYIYKNSNTVQSFLLWTSILKLCETIDGCAEIHLPDGYKAIRSYSKLEIVKGELDEGADLPYEAPFGQWIEVKKDVRLYIGNLTEMLDVEPSSAKQVYYFSKKKPLFPLFIRVRQDGDRISLKGMSSPKRLSRLFIDDKIPLNARDSWPLLVSSNNEVLAVIGVRVSNYFSEEKRSNDDMVLIIEKATS